MYQLKIAVNPESAEDVLDLQAWMNNEQEQQLHPLRVAVPDGASMGFGEFLLVIISSSAVSGLTACLRTWLKVRRPQVSLTLHAPSGAKVTLSAENVGNEDEIVAAVARLMEHEQPAP